MDTEMALWSEMPKGLETLHSLSLASFDAQNRYKGQPLAGSIASKELSQYAGDSVLQEAYGKGARSLYVACDAALALDRTLSEPLLSYSPWVCLRHIYESCSICIWMLDVSISPKERAIRYLNVQFDEDKHKLTFMRKLLSGGPASERGREEYKKAEASRERLKDQAHKLGIKENRKNGKVLRFGDGPETNITKRIESTLKNWNEGGTLFLYSLLSPLAHGDSWALLALSTEIKSLNPVHAVSGIAPSHVLGIILDSLLAIAASLRNYYSLHGYDMAEYSKIVEPGQEYINQVSQILLASALAGN